MQMSPGASAPLWKRLAATLLIDVPIVLAVYLLVLLAIPRLLDSLGGRRLVVLPGIFLESVLGPLIGGGADQMTDGVSATAFALGLLVWLLAPFLLISLLYFTIGYRLRQTLGKRLMGIAVSGSPSGEKPGWWRAFLRAASLLPSWLAFYALLLALLPLVAALAAGNDEVRTVATFGVFLLVITLPSLANLLWVRLSPDHRGWHDRLAGTTVVESAATRQELTPRAGGSVGDEGAGAQAKG
ncbi:MAG: RDD family protein [Chloroflexota bacterium]